MKQILLILLLLPLASHAEDNIYSLIIKDHHFQPAEIIVPAARKSSS